MAGSERLEDRGSKVSRYPCRACLAVRGCFGRLMHRDFPLRNHTFSACQSRFVSSLLWLSAQSLNDTTRSFIGLICSPEFAALTKLSVNW